jgi:hypothetical protein
MSRPTAQQPYSSAALGGKSKSQPRRVAKKRATDDRKIAGGKPKARSDKFARGGRGKKGAATTNITIGSPHDQSTQQPAQPLFSAPARAPGAGTPTSATPPQGPMAGGLNPAAALGGLMRRGFANGGRTSAEHAVGDTLANKANTGMDLKKWTKPRSFLPRAGAESGEGRLDKERMQKKERTR